MMRYVARLFILILPALGLATALSAGPRYARVVVGTREAALSPRAVVEGNTVYAPVDLLTNLGANYAVGKQKVTVALDEGTAEFDLTERAGSPMIRVREVADALDIEHLWDGKTSTVRLIAKLVSVEFEDSVLTARFTLPVSAASPRLWPDPWRFSFDLAGAKIGAGTKTIHVGSADVLQVRAGQFTEDTARFVLDLSGKTNYRVLTPGLSREIKVAVGSAAAVKSQPAGISPKLQPTVVTPVSIDNIETEALGDTKLKVKIFTSNRATFKMLMLSSPQRIALDIRRAKLGMSTDDIDVDHPLLKGIRVGQQDDGIRVVLDMTRYIWFDTQADANSITVTLSLPASAGGRLAEKTVVIDAGHGGDDPGANGGGVREKNVNLLIAQRVKMALEEVGAKVIMTRDDDTFLSLATRPAIADNYSADFFISIHCNAIGIPDKLTGIETYYHPGQPSSRALALAVHDRLIQRTGMKDRGAHLDTKLYQSGLAVLRKANVPAILIECGYIDCSADRAKLCDDSYRATLAGAIVEGLRQYVEGRINSEDDD